MGKVFLVGAGPSDKGLLTIYGKELVERADCIIYDSLISDEILDFANDVSEKIFVGKRMGKHSASQEEINEILVSSAKKYECVVRLKGGDPFVFGRGGEEVRCLIENGISFEVIPGISSAISVPLLSGIPVTDRGVARSFHVFTGHTKDSENHLPFDFDVISKFEGTLIFLMGLHNLSLIVDGLITGGKKADTPCAVISDGASPFQKVVRGILSNINELVEENNISSPAIIVVGETASYSLVDETSLVKIHCGKTLVGITGTESFRNRLSNELTKREIVPVNLCNMKIKELPDVNILDRFFSSDNKKFPFETLAFTSQNAVNIFFERAKSCGFDFRKFSDTRIFVLGRGTSDALHEYGLIEDFEPDDYTTEALASLIITESRKDHSNILIPHAKRGSHDFTERLKEAGFDFTYLKIYDIEGNLYEAAEKVSKLSTITFASRSGAEEFMRLSKEKNISISDDMKFFCIGEGAAEYLKANGYKNVFTASTHSAEGLANCISKSDISDTSF